MSIYYISIKTEDEARMIQQMHGDLSMFMHIDCDEMWESADGVLGAKFYITDLNLSHVPI